MDTQAAVLYELEPVVAQNLDRHLSIDSGGTYSLSSAAAFEDAVARAAALGFTDVIAHWPREQGVYAGDERVLREVAARLPSLA